MITSENLSVRVDKRVKKDFADFCKNHGLRVATAVTMFAKRFMKDEDLLFCLYSKNVYEDDQKNAMMCIYFDPAVREEFSKFCKEFGISMGDIVRGFMNYCIAEQKFPFDELRNGKKTQKNTDK